MNGRECPSFVTAFDTEIEKIFDDRIMDIRDAFLAEFVSTGKLDSSFAPMIQSFLEIAAWIHTPANKTQSAEQQELNADILKIRILPLAHEIVGRLVRFNGLDPLK